jgi:hypothetical protein
VTRVPAPGSTAPTKSWDRRGESMRASSPSGSRAWSPLALSRVKSRKPPSAKRRAAERAQTRFRCGRPCTRRAPMGPHQPGPALVSVNTRADADALVPRNGSLSRLVQTAMGTPKMELWSRVASTFTHRAEKPSAGKIRNTGLSSGALCPRASRRRDKASARGSWGLFVGAQALLAGTFASPDGWDFGGP